MKFLTILLAIFCFGQTNAQSFQGEASVVPIARDGFYRLLISPKVSVHLNNDFSDIRIFDKQNHEVSYLLQKESPAYYAEHFYDYEIVEKKYTPGCCTSLILRNQNRTPINNIQLVLKKAEAAREATLLGSDDQQQWFAVKDRFILSPFNDPTEAVDVNIIDFPWSNYEFYQLRLNDSAKAPLNISKAGYYDARSALGNYTAIPLAKMSTADSVKEKRTYVRLLFEKPQFLDKLEIVVKGSRYYRRTATLSEKRVRKSKKGKRTEYFNLLETFELTSGRTAVLELSEVRAQELLIVIENEDNPPLIIAEVKPFQLNRYLTAWLKKDEQHTVKFGDRNLKVPSYDLAFFKDSIPNQPAVLEVANVTLYKKNETTVSQSFFTSKIVIWVAIVAVMIILGIMSVKLVRESGQSDMKN